MKPGQWKSGRGFLLLPFNFYKRQNPKKKEKERRRERGKRGKRGKKGKKGKESHVT